MQKLLGVLKKLTWLYAAIVMSLIMVAVLITAIAWNRAESAADVFGMETSMQIKIFAILFFPCLHIFCFAILLTGTNNIVGALARYIWIAIKALGTTIRTSGVAKAALYSFLSIIVVASCMGLMLIGYTYSLLFSPIILTVFCVWRTP